MPLGVFKTLNFLQRELASVPFLEFSSRPLSVTPDHKCIVNNLLPPALRELPGFLLAEWNLFSQASQSKSVRRARPLPSFTPRAAGHWHFSSARSLDGHALKYMHGKNKREKNLFPSNHNWFSHSLCDIDFACSAKHTPVKGRSADSLHDRGTQAACGRSREAVMKDEPT